MKHKHLILLACLYFSQGLPYGFFTQALPVMMREMGLSLPAISLASLLTLPWALKFLWAPVVDGVYNSRIGRRRSWIIPLQLLTALAMVGLAFIDPERGLWAVLGAFLVANFLAATQDVATDGLAVEILTPDQRGWGNGIQVAGYRVGMVVGGGAILIFFDQLAWLGAFLVMGGLILLASLPIVFYREPPTHREFSGIAFEDLWTFFQQPGMVSWLAILAFYKAGDYLGSGMFKPFLVDQGLDIADMGLLVGTYGFVLGMAGSLVGGGLVGIIGQWQAMIVFGIFQAISIGLYAFPAFGLGGTGNLYFVCLLEYFTGGMATAALFTLMMGACRPESAGTDYTIQASAVVIATGVAGAMSGWGAEYLGYGPHFMISSLVSFLGLIPVVIGFTRYRS